MAGPFFKQWRKYRGFTQDQVVDRLAMLDDPGIPTTAASLSRLENGKQSYTQRSLEALAGVYDCEPHELIGTDPFERDEAQEAATYLYGMDELGRRRAIAVLKAMQESVPDEERKTA
jgi:transcriptional regulator with XRE-family HTH domain